MNRILPYLLPLIGLLPAAACWMELLHRVRLYWRYGSQPFLNHVADGYFGVMYTIAAGAAAVLLLGLVLSIQAKSIQKITVYAVAAIIPLAYMTTLFFMNQQDMLVTYSEFVKNMGP